MIKDLLFFAFVFALVILMSAAAIKLFGSGQLMTEGKVLSRYNRFIYECVEVSKTTMGESNVSTFCSRFSFLKDVKVGERVKVKQYLSPFLFMDQVELEILK
jgi:hypothetical protein